MPETRFQWYAPMRSRSSTDAHRVATPLELLFDLCFVVAVAQAASSLHHELAIGHIADGVLGYAAVFFAIWWAWMNVTWFGSAFDTDDVFYRVAVMIQIGGALVLAAGVPRALEEGDFGIATLGYVIMRVALVGQWLRAAVEDPPCRPSALRYAIGVTACQIGWVALLAFDDGPMIAGWAVLAVAELAVPVWAERRVRTSWHPGHIAERYGLFTILVLGESVLASTVAVQQALDAGQPAVDLIGIAAGGVLVLFAMWWVYFDVPASAVIHRARTAFDQKFSKAPFLWGYGHLVVFASAAAVGTGLEIAVDRVVDPDHLALSRSEAGLVLAIPVSLYLLSLWALHRSMKPVGPMRDLAVLVTVVLVMATVPFGAPPLAVGIVLSALVSVGVVRSQRPRFVRGARST